MDFVIESQGYLVDVKMTHVMRGENSGQIITSQRSLQSVHRSPALKDPQVVMASFDAPRLMKLSCLLCFLKVLEEKFPKDTFLTGTRSNKLLGAVQMQSQPSPKRSWDSIFGHTHTLV